MKIVPINDRERQEYDEPEEIKDQITFDKFPEIYLFFFVRQSVIFTEKNKRADHKEHRYRDP